MNEHKLDGQGVAHLKSFGEYLEHNELELAADELEEVGRLNGSGPTFWHHMADAARLMALPRHVATYSKLEQHSVAQHPDGNVAT